MSTVQPHHSKSFHNNESVYNKLIPSPQIIPSNRFSNYNQSNISLLIIPSIIILSLLSGFIILIIKGLQVSSIDKYNTELIHEINTLIRKLNDSREKSIIIHKSIDELNKNKNQIEAQCNTTLSFMYKLQKDVNYKQNDITQLMNTIQLVESNIQLIKSIPHDNDNDNDNNKDTITVLNSLNQTIHDKVNKISALKSLITYLRNESKKQQMGIEPNPTYRELGIDSVLVRQEDQLYILNLWIAGKSMDYILLYRGSEHGFDPSVFHNLCDDKRSTIVLVNTEMGIIGGYTEALWNGWGPHKDKAAFVFNLKKERRYDIDPAMIDDAIHTEPGSFPNFGYKDLNIEMKVITSIFPQRYGKNYSSLDITNGRWQLDYNEMEVFHVVNKVKDY